MRLNALAWTLISKHGGDGNNYIQLIQDNKQREEFPFPFPPFSVLLCCCSSGFADQEITIALFWTLPGNVLKGLPSLLQLDSQRGQSGDLPRQPINVGNEIYRRCWHIAQMVAGFIFAKVQCSQDQWPGSSIFLPGPLDLDVEPLPLPALALLLPPPKLFELDVLLHVPWESTSDRPFSKARTKFSK